MCLNYKDSEKAGLKMIMLKCSFFTTFLAHFPFKKVFLYKNFCWRFKFWDVNNKKKVKKGEIFKNVLSKLIQIYKASWFHNKLNSELKTENFSIMTRKLPSVVVLNLSSHTTSKWRRNRIFLLFFFCQVINRNVKEKILEKLLWSFIVATYQLPLFRIADLIEFEKGRQMRLWAAKI